jgi:hypothetical protein
MRRQRSWQISEFKRKQSFAPRCHYRKGIMMISLKKSVLALSIGLAFATGALAAEMSKDAYKAEKEKIAVEYKAATARCASHAGNAKDICLVEAKGKEKVALAETEDRLASTRKSRYEVAVAKAEATYALANEHCDDKAGNVKDVCVKEAKSAEATAKADAKAQLEISDANAIANEKSADARTKADKQSVAARKDANTDKRSAEYAVAKEKCDAHSGDAKESCINQAKARFDM